jgi:hypothetical protein
MNTEPQINTNPAEPRSSSHFRLFGRIGLLVIVFGLLLWARFLLVTGHPRTALADPHEPPGRASSPANHASVANP